MSPPASLLDVVRRGVSDLAAVGAPAALIGGLAVGVHVVERATRDADFAVLALTDSEAERVSRDLEARNAWHWCSSRSMSDACPPFG